MLSVRRNWFRAASVAVVMWLVSMSASAAGLDGSSNLICATTDVVACTERWGCTLGQAKNFDLPEFVVIDVEAQVVRGTKHSRVEEVSPVKVMEVSGGHLILQGVENGRGWGISVNGETGDMAASLIGDALSFLVHGACTPI